MARVAPGRPVPEEKGAGVQAAVWNGRLEVRDDVEIRPPEPHEVVVRVRRAGLCHSDVSVVNGSIPYPTPVVLGHEGAGTVEAIGSAVRHVGVGDHVILATLGNCGQCDACDRGEPTHCRESFGRMGQPFTVGGEGAYQFANLGVFAERTVVTESQAVVIDPSVPFDVACLIGCAVATGSGAVLNRSNVRPGQSVVVIGVGGIGLSVVLAARLVGAGRIVAVDVNPAKEQAALDLGATEFLTVPADADLVGALKKLGLVDGVNHCFECSGDLTRLEQAVDLLGWGGTLTILGVPPIGSRASFTVQTLFPNKSILSCRYGAARPHHDFPMFAQLYLDGRFNLDRMVSASYPLADIATAIEDQHDGKLNRGVLSMD